MESQFVMLVEPEPDSRKFSKVVGPLLERIVDELAPEIVTVQLVTLTSPVFR
jgi:hypothetical protein